MILLLLLCIKKKTCWVWEQKVMWLPNESWKIIFFCFVLRPLHLCKRNKPISKWLLFNTHTHTDKKKVIWQKSYLPTKLEIFQTKFWEYQVVVVSWWYAPTNWISHAKRFWTRVEWLHPNEVIFSMIQFRIYDLKCKNEWSITFFHHPLTCSHVVFSSG